MKKSTLLMILSLVLAIALGVGSTLAYLTDSDGDVNVMTVGYVTITQNEQERVEIGKAEEGLQPFTPNKPMNPAVFEDYSHKEDVDANGWDVQIRDKVNNYVDKIVSVTNTGASDAYVRTIYAFPEAGDFDTTFNAAEQWFHWNGVSDTDTTPNNGWIWGRDEQTEWPGNTDNWVVYENVNIEVDGETKRYDVYVVTNKNVQKPGETTAPSLLGMYLDPRVDCQVNDATGEKNYTFTDATGKVWDLGDISTLEVLVLSQAVQSDGFNNAWDAFEEAFPVDENGAALASWLGDMEIGSPGEKWEDNSVPNYIYNVEQLRAAVKNGGTYKLGSDLKIEDLQSSGFGAYVTADCKIDLNGRNIQMNVEDTFYSLFYVNNGATLDVVGTGDVTIMNGYGDLIWCTNGATVNVHGGNWSEKSDKLAADLDPCEGIYANKNATINVYGGTYDWDCKPSATFNIKNGAGSTITLYGGSVKADEGFIYGHNDESFLADGYELQKTVDSNGATWQTIVKK